MYWADEAKLEIASQLKEVFGDEEVRKEWRSHAENKDWLKPGVVYAPYPDIAVKPFNTHQGKKGEEERKEIKAVYPQHESFFQNLFSENISFINENPRCLLAIEIEGSQKGKHMRGYIINTSILGYIGIVVVNEKLLDDAKKVKEYLDGAFKHGKIKEKVTKNLALFKYEDFKQKLEAFER